MDSNEHRQRIRETEARLEAVKELRSIDSRDMVRVHIADVDAPYLLDRVRALEAALGMAWCQSTGHDMSNPVYYCGICYAWINEAPHAPSCIVLTLPAPETVEADA